VSALLSGTARDWLEAQAGGIDVDAFDRGVLDALRFSAAGQHKKEKA
jgi:hypothetical protein